MHQAHGSTEPGFGKVADAFADNFLHHGEVGAAVCVYVDGKVAVDLWGGTADPVLGSPYTEDTLQLVFSATKGAVAVCAGMLSERGELDLDAPVASYWPEFAAGGKEELSARSILSHRAGLYAVDCALTLDDVLAVTPVVEALAAQTPYWVPGSAHGYHGFTYGWLMGEIVRRTTGRRLSTWFADEIASPLGLDFWIGLPAGEEGRVAPVLDPPPRSDTDADVFAAMLGPGTDGYRMATLDGVLPFLDASWLNTRAFHATEMPSANGITNARSLARMYAATIDDVARVRLLGPETVEAARAVHSSGRDRLLAVDTCFGLGFMLHSEFAPFLGPGSFGHPGAGGSVAFADPESRVGFAYVANQMGPHLASDPRAQALIDAVRLSIDRS